MSRLSRFLVLTMALLTVGVAGFGAQAATAGWIRVWPTRHLAGKPASPPAKKTTSSTTTTTTTPAPTSTTTPTPAPPPTPRTTTPTPTATTTPTTPAPPPAPTPSSSCSLYASPNGSDAGSGSADKPFATATALVAHLSPGRIGCLRAGTYSGSVVIRAGGITLTSAPNERAAIAGVLEVTDSANDVKVLDLDL